MPQIAYTRLPSPLIHACNPLSRHFSTHPTHYFMNVICSKFHRLFLCTPIPNSRKIVSGSDLSQQMWLFRRNGTSGFSSSSTAEEVTNGIDGSGLTAIVTGASSGIGSETARVLALRGVHVIMGARNVSTGKQVKEAIVNEIPAAKVEALELDLSSMASVIKFASEFTSSGQPLNLLINNAGIMATPYTLSKDNIELQFATNHLGHFLLTNLLLDTMKRTVGETKREGRIVNVSSEAHRFSYREGIRFERLNDQEGYNRWLAYGQSKLANLLHANELARRLKEDGVEISVNSVHPGVVTTNLFRHFGVWGGNLGLFEGFLGTLGKLLFKNVQQGASTTCYLALHPQIKGTTGAYFADNNMAKASGKAGDTDVAKKLWDFSMDLIK
ncbi:short-chain dehydrogenase TIC 32, chloroplastic-like [Primulina eburnea]|uniref:short-chain dehydrogenase TIC 32, chloroplastic-like n=1 Tax=Primulina eburnea TaxID=1245227 RepID=UPI003C6C88E6